MLVKVLIFHLVLSCVHVRSIRLISKASVYSSSNSIVLTNLSVNQCLCQASSEIAALNYFANGTCQLFTLTSCTYRLEINLQSQLYLFDSSFEPLRPGCTISGSELIRRLNGSVAINTAAIGPLCLLLDDRGYLVTLLPVSSSIERYDPATLTRIDRINITGSIPTSLSFYDGAYFISLLSNNITVMNSTTLAVINIISSPFLQGPRDIIFLNNGQTMVVAGYSNDYLVFFNRSTPDSTSYSFIYRIPFSYRSPFGLWRVNDTFFYGTSYANNTVLAYSAVNSSFWSEQLMIDARSIVSTGTGDGTHITVDRCGRFWFSMNAGGVLIYDRDGSYLGRFTSRYTWIFDLIITKNFTIFFSTAITSQLVRLQPDLNC